MDNNIFSGLKVIDFSTYVAAAVGSRILADYGAEVIKVEAPNPDPWRVNGASVGCPIREDENPIYDMCNINKKGLVLNMKDPAGLEVFFKLLEDADILITNIRLASLRKLGVDYDSIKDRFPKLIYAIVTGYGDKGPDVNLPGFDAAAFWARSGFLADMVVHGDEGVPYPVYTPLASGDTVTGTLLFSGIAAALYRREKTGHGERVDTSLFGASSWMTQPLIVATQEPYRNPYPKQRSTCMPFMIPYRCQDNEWMIVSVLDFARDYGKFCRTIGMESIMEEEKFADFKGALENRAEFIKRVEAAFAVKPRDEWDRLLTEADIVHAKVRHFREMADDEQAIANGYIKDYTFDSGTTIKMPSFPVHFTSAEEEPFTRGPLFGEHSVEILKEIGLDDEQIRKLCESGTVRTREK